MNHKSHPPSWYFSFLFCMIFINFWSGQHSLNQKGCWKKCELMAASRLKWGAGFNEFERLEIIMFFGFFCDAHLESLALRCGSKYSKCDLPLCFDQVCSERKHVAKLSRLWQVASPQLAAGLENCVYVAPRLQGRHDTLHLQRSEGRAISECDGRCKKNAFNDGCVRLDQGRVRHES